MDIDNLIRKAREAYDKRTSGGVIALPSGGVHHSDSKLVRISSLGMCPLKAAREKLGISPDIPELTTNSRNHENHWIVDHGNYTAPMIQIPLMWYAMTHIGYTFRAEIPVENREEGIAGRIDGLLEWEDCGQWIIEIKDTEGLERRSQGLPKFQYALQTMGYMLATGIYNASIITQNKWGWTVWDLVGSPDKGYRVYHRLPNGISMLYVEKPWEPKWNTPDVLNFTTVREEIRNHQRYLHMIKEANFDTVKAPITDPINHQDGWQCVWHHTKPTKTKTGLASPRCPFATRCHGMDNKDYVTRKIDSGYEIELDI